MQGDGWSVDGLEVSATVAARVERQSEIRVHIGTLPHADVGPCSHDAITMWSSLEHVHDPRTVVRAAREALRPGGLLLVSVPNIASWPFRVFGRAWYGLDLPRHLVHFTPATLARLLEGAGLRVCRIDHIGRDGWLRRSADRAKRLSMRSRTFQCLRSKPLAMAVSRWTEFASDAENIVVLAERTT